MIYSEYQVDVMEEKAWVNHMIAMHSNAASPTFKSL